MATGKLNKTIIIALAVSGLVLLACTGFWLVFSLSWGIGLSHWPQVPPPELFVTSKPKQEDISGVYHLIRQTVTTNGLAFLKGRDCRLEIRADGSFTVTNYPKWTQAYSSNLPSCEFISAAGKWHCETIGISYKGNSACNYFGVVFSGSSAGIEPLALRSDGSPYNLMLTYGDADEGLFMTFGKQ